MSGKSPTKGPRNTLVCTRWPESFSSWCHWQWLQVPLSRGVTSVTQGRCPFPMGKDMVARDNLGSTHPIRRKSFTRRSGARESASQGQTCVCVWCKTYMHVKAAGDDLVPGARYISLGPRLADRIGQTCRRRNEVSRTWSRQSLFLSQFGLCEG